MRGFRDVDCRRYVEISPWQIIRGKPEGVTPVCVEFDRTAEQLPQFVHPENATYVFGPEDDSVTAATRSECHRFVTIPTLHCTNLAAAVYIVLYDRMCKKMVLR
jgi:tRNA(Leu) C34 or U34 (ribose-2'-O)-methylase TrmL